MEVRDQLHRCIAALPRAERELIHAIYFEGMTEEEYAPRTKLTQPGDKKKKKSKGKNPEMNSGVMNMIGGFTVLRYQGRAAENE